MQTAGGDDRVVGGQVAAALYASSAGHDTVRPAPTCRLLDGELRRVNRLNAAHADAIGPDCDRASAARRASSFAADGLPAAVTLAGTAPTMRTSRCGNGIAMPFAANSFRIARLSELLRSSWPMCGSLIHTPSSSVMPLSAKLTKNAFGARSPRSTRGSRSAMSVSSAERLLDVAVVRHLHLHGDAHLAATCTNG